MLVPAFETDARHAHYTVMSTELGGMEEQVLMKARTASTASTGAVTGLKLWCTRRTVDNTPSRR